MADWSSLLRPELADLTAYLPAHGADLRAKLDANEAPPNPSARLREIATRAVAATPLERYPDATAEELRAALAHRTGARPEELVVGTGSDEVIALLYTAFSRPRERAAQPVALVPTPTFVMYRIAARAHGAKPVEVPLDAGWDLDVAGMRRAIELMRPSLVFLASPNNPTGNRFSEDRLRAVLDASGDALVVLDEAYVDFAGASLRGWRAHYPRLGILRTLSKLGLAALRVGWLEAEPALVRELDKVRAPFNLSAVSQAAATAILREGWEDVQTHVAAIVAERERLAASLRSFPGVDVTPSGGNFLWIGTPRPAGEVFEALRARGVLVRAFQGVGRMANRLRVSIGAPGENDAFVEALRAVLEA